VDVRTRSELPHVNCYSSGDGGKNFIAAKRRKSRKNMLPPIESADIVVVGAEIYGLLSPALSSRGGEGEDTARFAFAHA
jgi:hypothetical protein